MQYESTSQSEPELPVRLPRKRKPMLLGETGSWEVAPEELEKWMSRIEKTDSCWNPTRGFKTEWGHCQWGVKVNGKRRSTLAHRFVYFVINGSIPDGMLVLHNCPGGDNPWCVNPDHMYLGFDAHNSQDMERKGRGVHPRGPRHGRCKTTEDKVRQVLELRKDGFKPIYIANKLGISHGIVAKIFQGLNWSHISVEYGITPVSQLKYRKKVSLTFPLPL